MRIQRKMIWLVMIESGPSEDLSGHRERRLPCDLTSRCSAHAHFSDPLAWLKHSTRGCRLPLRINSRLLVVRFSVQFKALLSLSLLSQEKKETVMSEGKLKVSSNP